MFGAELTVASNGEEASDFPTIASDKLVHELAPGQMIGERYRLVEKIGEGGFATVFRAEQLDPVRREVALKVIKLGMDTRQVVARFGLERQALAVMDHPNIARVFDAGTAPTGRPYFVMELVRGRPITDYCDRHRLTIPERLRLFITVCQAVLWRSAKLSRVCSDKLSQRLEAEGAGSSFQGVEFSE
jgi:eukaryotic-like serine/threonine-protein kinase